MAGLSKNIPAPLRITQHEKSRKLEVEFSDGKCFSFSFEFLRVFSPSAEVRGHGPGQQVLQTGKQDVTILSLDPVGHYAVKPHFSDDHNTGIYSWDYLYQLGLDQQSLWKKYLDALNQAGASREAK